MLKNVWSKFSIGISLCLIICFLAACSVSQVGAGSVKDTADYLKAGERDIQA